MKNIIQNLTLVCTIILIAYSCSDDDNPEHDSGISGTWSLISYQCCTIPAEIYQPSDILWRFASNGNFTSEINVELKDNSQIPFSNEKTLTYTKTDTTITIDKVEYNFRFDETGDLILSDSPASDGPIIILTK